MTKHGRNDFVIPISDDHFNRAVVGDQCHCTIGEGVHDSMGTIIGALELKSVDANTIRVNPAFANGEECVGVSFAGTDADDREVIVQFLLEQSAAFKIAMTTDNRATAGMRKTAAKEPYVLKATDTRVRAKQKQPGVVGNKTFTPESHIKKMASKAAHDASSLEEAKDILQTRLETAERPYRLTPGLKKLAEERAEISFAAKGSRPGRKAPVRVFHNKRFFG